MKIERAISSLKEKQAIILRTDNDHWLYEPITTILKEMSELKKQLKLFRTAYLLIINEVLPDMDCDNCKYKNKKYCEDRDCHKAIHRYFLDKAKE